MKNNLQNCRRAKPKDSFAFLSFGRHILVKKM